MRKRVTVHYFLELLHTVKDHEQGGTNSKSLQYRATAVNHRQIMRLKFVEILTFWGQIIHLFMFSYHVSQKAAKKKKKLQKKSLPDFTINPHIATVVKPVSGMFHNNYGYREDKIKI